MNKKLFFLIIICSLLLSSCDYIDKKYVRTGFAIGTDVGVTIFTNKPHWTVTADLDDIFARIEKYEAILSCHIKDSLVSRLNEEKSLEVTDDFAYAVINAADYFANLTNGTFEPTLGEVLKLWEFSGTPKVPDNEQLTHALETVGYNQLKLNKESRLVSLENGSLDLGAIAKGSIVDKIAELLTSKGYINFLINGGGDIYVHGKFNGRRPWRIAVANPFDQNAFIDKFDFTDSAIVTSGDYQRFFTENGVKYHHIIDPKTGYPTDNDIHGVTVIAENATTADSLATAIFVMGLENATTFIEHYNRENENKIKVIIISGDKNNIIDTRIGF